MNNLALRRQQLLITGRVRAVATWNSAPLCGAGGSLWPRPGTWPGSRGGRWPPSPAPGGRTTRPPAPALGSKPTSAQDASSCAKVLLTRLLQIHATKTCSRDWTTLTGPGEEGRSGGSRPAKQGVISSLPGPTSPDCSTANQTSSYLSIWTIGNVLPQAFQGNNF